MVWADQAAQLKGINNMNERTFNERAEKLREPERVEKLEVPRVVNIVRSGNVKSVLDIGTGTGLFAEAFAKHGITVTGVDSNPDMIELAKTYLPDAEFKTASAESLPFENGLFDVVFMGQVLHEADDHLQAVKEAGRVAKIAVWVLERYYKTEDSGPPLAHRLSPLFMERLAKDGGFKNIDSVNLKNFVLYKLVK